MHGGATAFGRGTMTQATMASCIGVAVAMWPLLFVTAMAAAEPMIGGPVSRHVGHWNAPPKHCPSSMVTDAPLLGNGDVGAAVGGVVDGGVSMYVL